MLKKGSNVKKPVPFSEEVLQLIPTKMPPKLSDETPHKVRPRLPMYSRPVPVELAMWIPRYS